MKKLFIFILFSIFISGLFAAPKVPKYDFYEYFNNPDMTEYEYTTKDGNTTYSIIGYTNMNMNFRYSIDFRKITTKPDYATRIVILFETEKQLDNFINKFNSSKIEKEFERIKKILDENNASIINSSTGSSYSIDGSNIKF